MVHLQKMQKEASEKAVSRAIGEELRRVREAVGWSRGQLVAQLPSGIGDRTLLSYEHGTRHLTVIRLLELCRVLGTEAPTLLTNGLQRAQQDLTNLVLRVNLNQLLKDNAVKFRPMDQWAKNKLNQCPDGIAELSPSAVEELANCLGYPYQDVANYLAKFTPDTEATEAVEDRENFR